MKMEIKRLGINGEGIGYYKRKPVFVPGCFPYEIVDVKILEDKGSYYLGKLEKTLQKCRGHVESKCENKDCKSCPLIEIEEATQLKYKQNIFEEALRKYTDTEDLVVYPIVENPDRHYRNQMKLPFTFVDERIAVGTYLPGSNHIIPVHNCYVQKEGLNAMSEKILAVLNKHQVRVDERGTKAGLRYLLLRGFENEYQATFVTSAHILDEATVKDLSEIDSLVSIYESVITDRRVLTFFKKDIKHLYGRRKIKCAMKGYTVYLSPSAFFQLNLTQAIRMYEKAASYLKEGDTVLDAYCGIGSMSLFLSEKAKQLIGVENNPLAITDAKKNAEENKKKNMEFRMGDAAKELSGLNKKYRFDTIVVDPPRSGLSDAMIEAILKSKAKQLVYVSCNPSTLGKNLQALSTAYQIVETMPFDLFSETPLVESVTYLVHK